MPLTFMEYTEEAVARVFNAVDVEPNAEDCDRELLVAKEVEKFANYVNSLEPEAVLELFTNNSEYDYYMEILQSQGAQKLRDATIEYLGEELDMALWFELDNTDWQDPTNDDELYEL
jgi:hypothetical protein